MLHLIDVEIGQVLRRFVSRGALGTDRAAVALQAQTQFPPRRHSHTALLQRAWHWRNTLCASDAIYVALAETLEASLVTCDAQGGRRPGRDFGGLTADDGCWEGPVLAARIDAVARVLQ